MSELVFLVLEQKRKYYYSDLDGYSTSDLYAKGRLYEYLYLIKQGKKIGKISEYYHSNYPDLKNIIIGRDIVNLGKIKWSVFREIKDTFTF
ncbi:MAG: hypothetical protein ACXVAY_09995 [Mucilaginibacter sp.]